MTHTDEVRWIRANERSDPDSADESVLDRDTQWRQVRRPHADPDRDGELTTAVVFGLADAEDVAREE